MKKMFYIRSLNGSNYVWSPLSYSDYDSIIVPSVCVIHCWKVYDHKYGLEAFFYFSHNIYSTCYYRSKSELFGAIQFLLQKELNFDVQ